MWYSSAATTSMPKYAKEYIWPISYEMSLWVYNEIYQQSSYKPTMILTSDPYSVSAEVENEEVEKFMNRTDLNYCCIRVIFGEEI